MASSILIVKSDGILIDSKVPIAKLQIVTNLRFREAYIHIRMAGLGRWPVAKS
jgi:hypothetical protein